MGHTGAENTFQVSDRNMQPQMSSSPVIPLVEQNKLEPENLEFNDAPRVIWIRVKDAINLIWQQNPKLHSQSDLRSSIAKFGFQELPKFDNQLVNVRGTRGAIKAGNGRVEALYEMEREGNFSLPRGLARDKATDDWVLPILFGTDAPNEALAQAYGLDSNNITLGDNFDIWQMAQLWDREGYSNLLRSFQAENVYPVSMNENDIKDYLRIFDNGIAGKSFDETVAGGVQVEAVFKIRLPVDDVEAIEAPLKEFLEQFPQARMEKIV